MAEEIDNQELNDDESVVVAENSQEKENLEIGMPVSSAEALPEEPAAGPDYPSDYGFLFSIAGLILLADQLTKWWVRQNIPIGHAWGGLEWLEPYARLIHWKNTGTAFGLFPQFGGVFTVIAIVVVLAIIYYFPSVPRQDRALRLALGLELGGALGNLTDRVTQGWVTDFISVGSFPVFNIADASISVGIAVLMLGMILEERRDDEEAESGLAEEVADRDPEEEAIEAPRQAGGESDSELWAGSGPEGGERS